jgi:hypothetical protein
LPPTREPRFFDFQKRRHHCTRSGDSELPEKRGGMAARVRCTVFGDSSGTVLPLCRVGARPSSPGKIGVTAPCGLAWCAPDTIFGTALACVGLLRDVIARFVNTAELDFRGVGIIGDRKYDKLIQSARRTEAVAHDQCAGRCSATVQMQIGHRQIGRLLASSWIWLIVFYRTYGE